MEVVVQHLKSFGSRKTKLSLKNVFESLVEKRSVEVRRDQLVLLVEGLEEHHKKLKSF